MVDIDRNFSRLLKENGYAPIRQNGSHIIWRNSERNDSISINRNANRMVIRRLIKEHALKVN